MKITMPQNSHFRLPHCHRFFVKNGSYGYGAKSRWGPHRVHLGANGVPLVKKRVKSVKNYHAAKFEFSITPRSSIFCKNGSYGYGAKSQWGPCRVHLGANGVPLGPKNGSKAWKITMPQNSNLRLSRGHRFFCKKMEVTVMVPNHGGDPVGSILGPMGSHWVKKWVKTVKNCHAPKFELSTTPRS